MTPVELREARESLGLSPAEAAQMLDISNPKAVYRMESATSHSTHRAPSTRVVRLYRAYLAGYRPDDWPARLLEQEPLPEEAKT